MAERGRERIAVIDTETNWDNALMSVGVVLADAKTLRPLDALYLIVTPEHERGGLYADRLALYEPSDLLFRFEAGERLQGFLKRHGVRRVFAYNARFDLGVLPELSNFVWHDIMRLAAYREFNKCIPEAAECFGTGRLKRDYGVEPMLRLLSGRRDYFETHNAMLDAFDELTIMRLLGHDIEEYACAVVRCAETKK